MLKNNLRKLIVCVLAIVLLALVMKTSFATDNGIDILNQLPNENVQQIPEGENTTTQPENTTLNTNTNTNTNINTNPNTNTNTNTNTNVPTTTPHTGIGNDFTIVFVAIFIASAIYAYKKIKEYNA